MTGRPAADRASRGPARRAIAVVATADTKSAEAAFVRDQLRRHGWSARIVDVGLGAVQPGREVVDVPAEQVASAAGSRLAPLREGARRDEAIAAMARGAGRVLAAWHRRGELAGVIGLGGNQGTAIAAGAMRDLPFGVPKLIVSTVASGNVRGFVGDSDIAMMFSVGDLLGGPNPVTAQALRLAAGALAGMAETADRAFEEAEVAAPPPTPPSRDLAETRTDELELLQDHGQGTGTHGHGTGTHGHGTGTHGHGTGTHERPLVAITAFGNTHAAVSTAMERLAQAGVGTVPFHASGASGSAMERLIDSGLFSGVLDLTTHELLGELYPDDIYTPVRPGRLTAAGRQGIPQVVAPGGLEYHCFAAAETIPARLRDRPTHHHNPNNTNVRASARELIAVAEAMAGRLAAATGPVAVLVPRQGWSEVGSPGGILHDPPANAAFVAELRRALPTRVLLRELDRTINDPVFATIAADTLLDFLAPAGRGAERDPNASRSKPAVASPTYPKDHVHR